MDWNLAIERNREALKRIVAMLVAMAGLANLASPLAGENGPAPRGKAEPLGGAGEGFLTLPRHLHRATLRLLRPAESAVRRLVIVVARGLVVTLPPTRLRKEKPNPAILRNGVVLRRGVLPAFPPRTPSARRTIALPLFDPLRPVRPRRAAATGVPRISLPGITALFPIPPGRPVTPDDLIDATRLSLRLKALTTALDDLPRQARRLARWQARSRVVAAAQDAAGQGRPRRIWPLRPGRPPGQRSARRRAHQIHEILHDLHGLAFDVLEHPDTS